MKRVLFSAAVIGLFAASPALALNDHHNHNSSEGSGQTHTWSGQGAASGGTGGSSGGHHHNSGGTSVGTSGTGAWTGGSGASGHDHKSHDSHGSVGVWTDHNSHDGNAGWRGWHNGHNNNWDSYRRAWSSPQRYHWGSYHRPSGWYYRRWAIGAFLPALFYTHNYWIHDYAEFDLGAPPPGTVWVRYGSDALLIDEYSGEVVQVVYGVFY